MVLTSVLCRCGTSGWLGLLGLVVFRVLMGFLWL